MEKIIISGAIRTPMGILNGNLKTFTEQKLAAIAMTELVKEAGIIPENIDEIIIGNSKQTSTPSNCARHAQLEAELPESIPAYTVQRQSGSGIQAVYNGFLSIKSGNASVIMAGGTESMSNIPIEIRDARFRFGADTEIVFDPIKAQVSGAQPKSMYGELINETIAENIALQYGISPAQKAEYMESRKEKILTEKMPYIVPIEVKKKKVTETVDMDQMYPEVCETSNPADCAAMCLICSETIAKEQGLPQLGELISFGVSSGSPSGRGFVDIKSAKIALSKGNISISQLDFIDIGEFSATQVLATEKELIKIGADASIVNKCSAGLCTGVAWGALGAVMITDMLHKLESNKYGLVIVPIEGGQTMSVLLKKM